MKNRHNPIHKAILAVALVTGLHGVAQAYDPAFDTEFDQVSVDFESASFESTRDDQMTSVGIGALIGALAGGPPGLIIGMLGMNAIDSYQHHEAEQQQSAHLSDQDEQEVVATPESQQQTETLAAFESYDPTDIQVASLSAIKPDRGQYQLEQALATHFEQWVQFRTAQAELEPHLQKQLIRAATWMSQMPSVRIELHGFTDPRGADQDNMALSRARLDSVRRALIAGGIDAGRITGYAHGESLPLYNGDDTESNSFERRVLISFQIQEVQS